MPDQTMTAVVLEDFGDPDAFRETTLDTPTPGLGQVLVRVEATSVNPVDYKIRSGAAAALAPDEPRILHMDVAGTVADVGEGVTAFAIGDDVFGCAGGIAGAEGPLQGALADFMVCDPDLLAPKPVSLSFREAAALPLVWLTAWEGLAWTKTSVNEGDRVLVYGGTGGVGHMAVQLAKALGAEVTATASSDAKRQTAKDLGADHVSDYRTESTEALVERVTGGAGFDVVFDTVGGDNIATAFEAARTNGHVVTTTSSQPLDLSPMHQKGLSLHVVFMLLPMLTGVDRARHGEALRYAAELVAAGQLRPLLDDQRFGLFDAEAAHAHAESGDVVGKVTLARDDA
ncbi:zinc-dependent alcohol dehydrogenase family protein [Rubrivirga sp. IMCC45206]|uniref:zinc-dependent alcohol dehydrogenase family protein n=1 Tax=Rubrivirga sp. IMCC45206 TaxID=3391614 RepID=UPI00398FD6F3